MRVREGKKFFALSHRDYDEVVTTVIAALGADAQARRA